jgi:hypothetical protein
VGADERRMLERTHEDLTSDVAIIASEFLGGFQKVLEIDRPAVSIFGSARVGEGSRPYELARATAKLFARPTAAARTAGVSASASTSTSRTSRVSIRTATSR